MGKYRTLSKKNQYYLPPRIYSACVYYARQYRDWLEILNAERDTRGAIRYDRDNVQASNEYDSTSETAMRMVRITDRVAKIDACIELACDQKEMEKWLRLGVCYDYKEHQLLNMGMPCSRDLYAKHRHKFYWELSKKI